jgi:hypothetical protein
MLAFYLAVPIVLGGVAFGTDAPALSRGYHSASAVARVARADHAVSPTLTPTQSHAHTQAPTHTHTCARARTHAFAHTHAHEHTRERARKRAQTHETAHPQDL